MNIDWFTVAAQIGNFLILVWLLQHFLYGPVIRAMDRREERIRARLVDAERTKAEAAGEAAAYRAQQAALEQRADQMLTEARGIAAAERKALEEAARQEIDARKREWSQQIAAQRDAFTGELRRRSVEQFYTLARQALGDLAGADLQEQIAVRFADQVDGLGPDARDALVHEFGEAGGPVRVRSRFDLSGNAKRQITRSVHKLLAADAEVAYETVADLSCGVELKVGGRTLAWTLDSYLDGLERSVETHFAAVPTPTPTPVAGPAAP